MKEETSYILDRNRAYTVGRKNCGNGIELGNDANHLGASVLAASLIPAPDKQMWVLVPTKNIDVTVRHQQKAFMVAKRRVVFVPWGITDCYIDLDPIFGLGIDTRAT